MLPAESKHYSGFWKYIYRQKCLSLITCFNLNRGYQERVIFRVKKAEKLETEKKLKMMEDFAELVLRHQNLQKPFPSKSPGMWRERERERERDSALFVPLRNSLK